MEIKTVEYKRLVTHGDYQNTTLGATGAVGEFDYPDKIVAQLQEFVDGELEKLVTSKDDEYELRNSVRNLEYQKSNLQREINTLKSEYEKLRKVLETHGVELPREPHYLFDEDDGMPF